MDVDFFKSKRSFLLLFSWFWSSWPINGNFFIFDFFCSWASFTSILWRRIHDKTVINVWRHQLMLCRGFVFKYVWFWFHLVKKRVLWLSDVLLVMEDALMRMSHIGKCANIYQICTETLSHICWLYIVQYSFPGSLCPYKSWQHF